MKELNLVKGYHALPFTTALRQNNIPIASLAKQAGLPLEAVLSGEGVIGERALWRFIEYAAAQMDDPVFGYHCAATGPQVKNGRLGAMPLSKNTSLEKILQQFFEDARKESAGSNYVLAVDGDYTWLRRTPIFHGAQNSWQVEQYMLQSFINIVRVCGGPGWIPGEVFVSASKTPKPVPEEWKNIRFAWGQNLTAIKIPNDILAQQPNPEYFVDPLSKDGQATPHNALEVRELIEQQLATGNATLDNAADELGISPATLKRRLKAMGTNYSSLLENCRLATAKTLLLTTNISVNRLSADLGYKHQQNFTRSFKRAMEMTPTQFRKQRS